MEEKNWWNATRAVKLVREDVFFFICGETFYIGTSGRKIAGATLFFLQRVVKYKGTWCTSIWWFSRWFYSCLLYYKTIYQEYRRGMTFFLAVPVSFVIRTKRQRLCSVHAESQEVANNNSARDKLANGRNWKWGPNTQWIESLYRRVYFAFLGVHSCVNEPQRHQISSAMRSGQYTVKVFAVFSLTLTFARDPLFSLLFSFPFSPLFLFQFPSPLLLSLLLSVSLNV